MNKTDYAPLKMNKQQAIRSNPINELNTYF